jgi:hypothetical protein
MKLAHAAVGFRVKSGWATAILLVGPVQSPQVLDHRVIGLSDPSVPESKQPYHARMGTLEEVSAKIERRTKVVQRVTTKSVTDLLKFYRDSDYKIRGAGLVVGSQIDPASIKNPHIRAHALEGRLFRTMLEDALRLHGLRCLIVVERNAYSKAATVLAKSEDELKRTVSGFGKSLSGPWRADEKLAALAAWMALA